MMLRRYWNHWSFYIRKHGFFECGKVMFRKSRRKLFARSEWMYSVNLNAVELGSSSNTVEQELKVFAKAEDIDANSISQLRRFKSEFELMRLLDHFFAKGATLWLAKQDDEITALLWTLPRGFKGFYSLPISSNEVIILAVEVFPAYRGRGLFPQITTSLFQALKRSGYSRAYLKVGEWNSSMRRSMEKIPCVVLGRVLTFSLGSSALTIWRDTNRERDVMGNRTRNL